MLALHFYSYSRPPCNELGSVPAGWLPWSGAVWAKGWLAWLCWQGRASGLTPPGLMRRSHVHTLAGLAGIWYSSNRASSQSLLTIHLHNYSKWVMSCLSTPLRVRFRRKMAVRTEAWNDGVITPGTIRSQSAFDTLSDYTTHGPSLYWVSLNGILTSKLII